MKKRCIPIIISFLMLTSCSGKNTSTSIPEYSAKNETVECVSAQTETVPFRGTDKDVKTISTVNYREFRPAIFCYNGDTIYFSWDGAVYSFNGTEKTKLFEANAFDLNYYNGSIYYIVNNSYKLASGDLVNISGIPYKYEISSGKVTQLSDTPIAKMLVLEDGIFWTDYVYADDPNATGPTGICRLDEETGRSERLYNGFSYIEYNGLRLKFNVTNDGLQFMFFDENGAYMLDGVSASKEFICGDNFYYISMKDGTLNRISMLTGENTAHVRYSEDMLPPGSEKLFSYADLTVLNDEIYIADTSFKLCRYDASTQTINEFPNGNGFWYLYTDGKSIYTVEKLYNGKSMEYHFGKVILDGNSATIDIII